MANKKVLKTKHKIYIADAAIRNAVLMEDNLLGHAEKNWYREIE